MMTPNQEQKLLDSKASAIEKELSAAYDQFLELLDKGTAPRDAVSKVMKSFRGAYAKELAGGFREILQQSVGEKSVLEMRVAGISLSKRLYKESGATSAVVAGIVNRHAKGWQSARDLTLEIFEGYGFKDKEALNLSPRNPKLPKYLREELLVDPGVQGALARHFARAQALRLKTPALKAAYLEYLGAIETGAGRELLDKRLQTAFYERMRYFANRIAQTELHRAYADMQAREVMADEDVQFVQYRMSRTHPKTDICDLWAKQDLYGLGPGVYPKAQCPKAPQHPHCRCNCSPRLDISDSAKARLHPGASQDYLRSLDEREAARVMGSKARLQAVLQGQDPLDVWNTNTDPMYRVRLVGDVARGGGVGVRAGMSDASFGKFGDLVDVNHDHPVTIPGRGHAARRMAERGMTPEDINGIVKNAVGAFSQGTGKTLFIAESGAAVFMADGRMVTAYPESEFDDSMKDLLESLRGIKK